MARKLTWSPEAIEDIEAIASYIERDSLQYARTVASKIVEIVFGHQGSVSRFVL